MLLETGQRAEGFNVVTLAFLTVNQDLTMSTMCRLAARLCQLERALVRSDYVCLCRLGRAGCNNVRFTLQAVSG